MTTLTADCTWRLRQTVVVVGVLCAVMFSTLSARAEGLDGGGGAGDVPLVPWRWGVPSTNYKPSPLRFGLLAPPPVPAGVGRWFVTGNRPAGHPANVFSPGRAVPHDATIDNRTCPATYYEQDFSADPCYDCQQMNSCEECVIYGGKYPVPVQHPLVEFGFPFYRNGPTPEWSEWTGATNPSLTKFYIYGDYRVAFAQNKNLVDGDPYTTEELTILAHRLNLDWDLWITATERLHMFTGPFQEDTEFMRVEDGIFIEELDFFDEDTDNAYFEGDLGAMWAGVSGGYAPIDMPVTAGLVPMLFQNGVFFLDAAVGLAATLPARNSPILDWSNYDVTFFAFFDKVNVAADALDQNRFELYGVHTFIESRGGYLEVGYAFANDTEEGDRSVHTIGASYARRYMNLLSNTVRTIVNIDADRDPYSPSDDALLLLVENTFITRKPYNFLPYVNLFAGFGAPQKAAGAGNLFNTGILFQSDTLTGYPKLDDTGNDTFGAAMGINCIREKDFGSQLIVEAVALGVRGGPGDQNAFDDQFGVGVRYQLPVTNAHLWRFDAMYGFLDNSEDIFGARIEYRWKF